MLNIKTVLILYNFWYNLNKYCFSVTKLCPTPCDPMNCSTPGFSVHHYLPELPQIHVHWVSDAIQPSHSLSPLLFLPSVFALFAFLPSPCWPRDSRESSAAHSWKASILLRSAFIMVQLSHLCMTTAKTLALTIQIVVGKVITLLFKTMSRFDIAIFQRSKRLLISWLQSPSALILEPKKMKSHIISTFSPSMCPDVIGLDAMILVFWMLSFKPVF